MCTAMFALSESATVNTASIFPTVTDHPIPVDKPGTICSCEEKINVQGYVVAIGQGVPHQKPLSLNGHKVMEAREKK